MKNTEDLFSNPNLCVRRCIFLKHLSLWSVLKMVLFEAPSLILQYLEFTKGPKKARSIQKTNK